MATGLAEYLRRGAHDDGGEGYKRVAVTRGELVPTPFGVGAATATSGTATALITGGNAVNADRTGMAGFLSVNAGIGNVARITDTIYGRVLGVRVYRDATAANYPFSVVCDGIVYAVGNVKARRNASTTGAPTDNVDYLVLDRDLPDDGPHTVDIVLNPDVTGGSTRQLTPLGWLTDGAAGYKQHPPWGFMGSTGLVLTTSFQAVPAGPVRALCFSNADTVAHVATIKVSGNVFRDITIPAAGGTPSAKGYAEHLFPQPMGGWGSISVAVDSGGTGSTVTMWSPQGDVK